MQEHHRINLVLVVALVVLCVFAYTLFQLLQQNKLSQSTVLIDDIVMSNTSIERCNEAEKTSEQRSCFSKAMLVFEKNACELVSFDDLKQECIAYHEAIEQASGDPEFQGRKQTLTYETSSLHVTYSDNTEQQLEVLLAGQRNQRVQGLSYRTREDLPQGMLFSFDTTGEHPFIMRDMLTSLDMYFLNEEFEILQTYRYLPSCLGLTDVVACQLQGEGLHDVRYVLEVPVTGKTITQIKAPLATNQELQ